FADLILSMLRPQPSAPLFPYTTLFRSRHCTVGVAGAPIKAPARGPSALLRAQELARVGHPAVLPDLEVDVGAGAAAGAAGPGDLDRKSTRLNSSHVKISYAVFCLKHKT